VTARSSRLLCMVLALAAWAAAVPAWCQPYWVEDLGSGGNDHVADVQVDTDGSIYVTGEFGGTVSFGGQSYASAGSIDFFVARMDANGDVVWFKHGGGTGIDRGLKVAVGNGAVIAIVGEFLGTATFQAQTMTSVGGTADMYVAVLNKSDGTLQWMRQGGGGAGTDRPSGVSIASSGTVTVAGEFRGSASWDGNTITSMTNPDTNQPSADVFVCSYSSVGALLWLEQGTAKYDDRAVDVVHDALGNVFITGQFSDTITFDQAHTNALLNATFLVSYTPQGSEQWCRHFGGAAFNHVRDMVTAPNDRLLLVGDVQGTMTWPGPPQTSIPSANPFAYYIMAVSGSGVLLTHSTYGSESGVGVSGLSQSGGDLAVLGWFNCQFTDLAEFYGATGLFMASGAEDLFVARHNGASFGLVEAQQFGGRSEKVPGAVAHISPDDVVFSGSFQVELIFPAEPSFTADLSSGTNDIIGNGVSSYCGDDDYGYFVGSESAGLTDGFVARGYVQGREPYDWWTRSGLGCDRSALEPCIRQGASNECPDTLTVCGPTGLNLNTRYSHAVNASAHYLGPPITYEWSTGSTAPGIVAATTGWYWCNSGTVNGCWDWTDSIYVVVNTPPPIPLISDDVVVNTNTTSPQLIELCDPETHWVWATGIGVGTTFEWGTPFNGDVLSDSVQVDTTGTYVFTVIGANGCTRTLTVEVIDNPSPEMPDLGLDLQIEFLQDPDLNDTVQLCGNTNLLYTYIPQWFVDGVPVDFPDGLLFFWSQAPDPPELPGPGTEGNGDMVVDGPGWYVVEILVRVVNAPCGVDTLEFSALDSIYVETFPPIEVTVDLSGPIVLCDGDTTLLVATCTGCDTLIWSGDPALVTDAGSLQVSAGGTYYVEASAEDANGCQYSDQASITIVMPVGPVLDVDPENGILCPNTSATLSTDLVGASYVWYGPQGPITGEGLSLTTNVPGEYYLTMVIDGCSVTSNNVALVNYGTPYFDVQPSTVLCNPGDAVQIQVVAAAGANIAWAPPINGSAANVTITQPGTYSCVVISCGITTTLSVEVTADPAAAALLTPGPFILCEGESVLLQAAAGMASYTWLPALVSSQDLLVSSAGEYSVIVENAGGCTDTSAVVLVDQILFVDPLSITGDTVCAGDAAQLVSIGSGPVVWYADAAFSNTIGSGPSLTFMPTTSGLVYARQEQSVCIGDSANAYVLVKPRPAPISIQGPEEICTGDVMTFSVNAPDSVSLIWSTPMGTFTGDAINVDPVSLANAGNYSCQASYEGCNSAMTTLNLIVHVPQQPELPPYAEICLGGAASFAMPPGYTSILWSTGSTANAITVTTSMDITVTAQDANGCAVLQQMQVVAEECPLVVPNIFSPNGDGTNETWYPSGGFTSANAWIYGRWGNLVHEGNVMVNGWNGNLHNTGEPCPDGVYFYVLNLPRTDGATGQQHGHIQLVR
jgi:gliding motility-associated-like protein